MATSTLSGTGNQAYTAARIDYLATYLQGQLPGLTHDAAVRWITAEKGVNGNVLGVTYKDANGQHLYTYASQEAGLRAAASLIKNGPYGGVRAALPSQDTTAQLRALAASPWSGGGYYANLWKSIIGPLSSSGGDGSTPTTGLTGSGTSSVPQGITVSTTTDTVNRYLTTHNIDPNSKITTQTLLDYLTWLSTQPEGQSGDNKTWLQGGLLDPNSSLFKLYAQGWVGETWSRFGTGQGKTISPALDPLAGIAGTIGDIGAVLFDPDNWKYLAAIVVGVPLALVGFYLLAGVQTGGANA